MRIPSSRVLPAGFERALHILAPLGAGEPGLRRGRFLARRTSLRTGTFQRLRFPGASNSD